MSHCSAMRKSILLIISLIAVFAVGCDLTEDQKATAGRDMVFGSEAGLHAYIYSLYINNLPDYSDAFCMSTTMDNAAKKGLSVYESGAYSKETSTSWSWSSLRNINYFIKHNISGDVPEQVRNHYTGIARFFRAWFYYDKLVIYGEVPWIDEPLEPESPELYASQDSRDVIISNIMDDLDYAYANITTSSIVSGANEINKWAPLLLKARACLFEASFRKYHAGSQYLKNSVIPYDTLYVRAAKAAYTLRTKGPYRLHTGTDYANGRGAYRDLFISDDPVEEEVLLSVGCDKNIKLGYQNFWYNSPSYGSRLCMTRTMANTYLNRDGSFHVDTHQSFAAETTDRDLRLNQTIRCSDYTCKAGDGAYALTPPNMTGHSLTGYQFTKYVIDDVSFDGGQTNYNDIPIMRLAEALLVEAEAKAELGTITDEEWSATIGALRRRAGITGGALDNLPATSDPCMKALYPGIEDKPVLLEIRRERECELILEGQRIDDLKRWACGHLWADAPWDGIWFASLDTPVDINGDGINDAYFTTDESYASNGTYKALYVGVKTSGNDNGLFAVPATGGGYILEFRLPRIWNDNMYLYPIPAQSIILNPNLKQNLGW